MPAERIRKKRTSRDVPDLGNPDRKRVLNRRKEKIAALEAQAKDPVTSAHHWPTSRESVSPAANSACGDLETIEGFVNVSCEDGQPTYAFHETSFDTSLMQDLGSKTWDLSSSGLTESYLSDFPTLPTPFPSTPDLVEPQQEPRLDNFDFPLTADGGVLAIPIMSAIRAFVSIATALNVGDNLWDPSYLHVMPASASCQASLPMNLRPVNAQLVIPHHPSLDLLPWPSMRQKLICMLAMPSKLRPPIAREEDEADTNPTEMGLSSQDPCDSSSSVASMGQSRAIVRLVQDLEDLQDGIQVHGNTAAWGHGNEFVEEAWEVGEQFYSKWWWCCDQKIIEQSNKRRRKRGLGKLRITA
ncbi:hypothetical protein N0V95_001880 [Ascochyta clinopodiicola]|nr:hypothetical protein N0V95_001880 [Ascochyta clinopodiicola]